MRPKINNSYKQKGIKGGGVRREHVVIAEKALGRPLPLGSEVHHADEDKTNNKNNNLVICESRAYHMLLHKRKRSVDAGYPASWLQCVFCKKFERPEVFAECHTKPIRHNACGARHMRMKRAAARQLLSVTSAEAEIYAL